LNIKKKSENMTSEHICFQAQEVLFKFMRSFDDKDFEIMKECLHDKIFCDYSSFRKEEPSTIRAIDYCEKRKKSLFNLTTQHNILNVSIEENVELEIRIVCNYIIYRFGKRFLDKKDDFFHSYGRYEFGLKPDKKTTKLKIHSIKQQVFMNDGNSKIHTGLTSTPKT